MRRIPKEVLDALSTVPLFSACSKVELRMIANMGTEVAVPDGKAITEQGKPGREFCLIVEGAARCLVDGEQVATFGPGDFFGEMSLLDRGPRRATIISDGPTLLLVLDSTEFARLLDSSPSTAKKLLLAFAARQRANANLQH